MASITLTLEEYKAHERQVAELEAKVNSLADEVINARRDPEGRIQKLEELVGAFMPVLRFAVGNLPPSEIANWPTTSLRAIALLLPNMPAFSDDDRTLTTELLAFADEADREERYRSVKRDLARGQLGTPPTIKKLESKPQT